MSLEINVEWRMMDITKEIEMTTDQIIVFEVDEDVIMHSPFTDEDTVVNFRGKVNPTESMVYNKKSGWQGAVPTKWLKKLEASNVQ
jgi:hypothetical protein